MCQPGDEKDLSPTSIHLGPQQLKSFRIFRLSGLQALDFTSLSLTALNLKPSALEELSEFQVLGPSGFRLYKSKPYSPKP